MLESTDSFEQIKQYYGRVLRSKSDLKTTACCTNNVRSDHHRRIVELIDEEILAKSYGCGSPLPPALDGAVVLDLGCGTGRDAYIASSLVGVSGRVIGVDMTEEQLRIAEKHLSAQMRRFGYLKPNIEFRQGYIEDLAAIGIGDDTVDVVISNCVINLSPDKERVFSEIFRVLKPGGELYFSDVFADRRVPEHLHDDPVLYGECLGGALYEHDFRRMLARVGILDYRVVSRSHIDLDDPEIRAKAGMVSFYSMTLRAFNLESLEDICEDYGQTAVYRGTIDETPHSFFLDGHHVFVAGKPMLVCGNTAAMVQETRYGRHFDVRGNRSLHYGAFPCGPLVRSADDGKGGGTCC